MFWRIVNNKKAVGNLLLLITSMISTSIFACNVSGTTTPGQIIFGVHPSQGVHSGGVSPNGTGVSARFSVTCPVTLSLQLLGGSSWLRYRAQQPLVLSNGVDSIAYTIASNSTYNPAITTQGGSIGGPTEFNLLSLGLLTSGVLTVPLHVRTSATSTWPSAGTYTGTQTFLIDGSICTGLGIGGICLGSSPVNATVAMSLTLEITKSCEFISTPNAVNLGSVSFVEGASAMQLQMTLRCTSTEDYVLYADNGNNYLANSRHMISALGHRIAYNIFHPLSSSILLTSTTPLSRMGTGLNETFSFPVRIAPAQPTPPEGAYSDSVRMTIEF